MPKGITPLGGVPLTTRAGDDTAIHWVEVLHKTQTASARTIPTGRVEDMGCVGHAFSVTGVIALNDDATTIPMCRNTLWDCAIRATRPGIASNASTASPMPNTFGMSNPRAASADPNPPSSTTITSPARCAVDSAHGATSTLELSRAGASSTAAASTLGLPNPLIANRSRLSSDGFAPDVPPDHNATQPLNSAASLRCRSRSSGD